MYLKKELQIISNNESEPLKVNKFLSEKGFNLTQENFHEAFHRALGQRNSITSFYPKTSKGIYFYHELIASLREISRLRGYNPLSHRNVELTTNGKIALHVCAGDEHVGNYNQYPYSKRKIGVATRELLNLTQNNNPTNQQVEMFDKSLNKEKGLLDEEVWSLFHKILDLPNGNIIIESELSKARFFNEKGFINGLDTRIILDPITLYPNTPLGEDVKFNDDYDIDISATG